MPQANFYAILTHHFFKNQSRMQSLSMLIFGEVLVDVFPEQAMIGGAPYNVARHLNAFGLAPFLITKVGSDAFGDNIVQAMQNHH